MFRFCSSLEPPPPDDDDDDREEENANAHNAASSTTDANDLAAATFFFRTTYKQVWSGSVFALAVMTALSALMGAMAPNVLNKTTTHYVATGLFFLFGARSIYEQTIGYDANAESELEEVEKELQVHVAMI